MVKKTKQDDVQEERQAHIKDAYTALKSAKSAKEVRALWQAHYLTIGHRILGRLLLGQDAESATRTRRKSE